MKRRLALGTLIVLACVSAPVRADDDVRQIGQLVLDGVPEIPDRIVERMNQYQNVRTAGFRSWIPGGGILATTRFGNVLQLHAIDEPMGMRRQVTFYPEAVTQGFFGNDPSWFLFMKDFGGNEASQMFRFDLTTGQAKLLTDGESQNGNPLFSPSKKWVAWRSTARNKRDHDVWVMDPMRPETKRIALQTEGYWYPLDWSPDETQLLVGHYVSVTEAYIWIVDVESGEKRPFGNQDRVNGETIRYGVATFDRKGKGVFYSSDESSEFRRLRYRDLASGKDRVVTSDLDWDVASFVSSPDRKRIAFTVNAGGRDELYFLDTRSLKARQVDLPVGLITAMDFSPDGKELGITFESPAAPRDVYTVHASSHEITQWTQSEVGGLDTSKFRTSEIVHFPSFDGLEIPAFVYRPEGEGPFPVVVRIHGGPESQSKAWFSYTSQYEVSELGCAVIYPNVRGSSGYGKTYVKLDNGFKREDSVKDIGALLDWIATQPDLDATRVGVTGGSYGGYMVLASLTHYSDRLRAGISSVGISNFVTFLENTSDYRRDLRRVEYGDERNPDMRKFQERISPTNNVDKIGIPLFVVQGANDPRVPASEAEQIVKAVRGKGKEAWYMLALDEGHGFRKKTNSNQRGYASSLFWESYLLDDQPRMKREKKKEIPNSSH